jgi:hypothetical protein
MNVAERAKYDSTLPPELPSWDADKPDLIGDKLTKFAVGSNNRGATSSVYGVFGSRTDFDDNDPEPQIEKTLSEVIFRRKESLWTKLSRLILSK